MKAKPEWLRAGFSSRPEAVDRQTNILRGFTLAQLGPFKSDGRGRFDEESLRQVVEMGNAKRDGLKSRFTHPGLSSDGLGKFLGRARNLRMSSATDERTGKTVAAVRGDLHFNKTALDTPPEGGKPLGVYVMELAESDAGAISSSLVLKPKMLIEDGKGGMLEVDDDFDIPNGVTPLWRIAELHATDIVDTGDAVDALLSPEQLTQALSVGMTPELAGVLKWDNVSRLGWQMLDGVFKGEPRTVVESRCLAWLNRYLGDRYGAEPGEPVEMPAVVKPRLEELAKRLEANKLAAQGLQRR